MGRITDREAKKKANHVYSGGSGGGTKGPSVVDKRKQELPCPHCERVFQQKDRFQAHLQSKHAGEAATAEADCPSTSSATDSAAEGATSGSASGMMTAGAKAGYYTSKSPHVLLIEQCHSEGRIKPRVKVQGKGGKWGCKVVLPHVRKKELDVVVFVPDEMLAGDEGEAKEVGSLTALHRIAGHRALDRILPKQYLPQWKRLGELADARAEQNAKHAARAQQTKEREARRNKQELKDLLTTCGVTMTTDKVDLVQRLISQASVAMHDVPNGERPTLDATVTRKLEGMGLCDQHIQLAAASVRGASTAEDLLDWLCIHMDAVDLPPSLRGRHRGGVSVIRTAAAGLGQGGMDLSELEDPSVCFLTQFGYSAGDAVQALKRRDGDIAAAWGLLFGLATGASLGPVQLDRLALADCMATGDSSVIELDNVDSKDDVTQAWLDELTVLLSMYEDEVLHASRHCAQLRLTLPPVFYKQYSRAEDSRGDIPDVHIVAMAWPSCSYPDALPLFGIRSAGLPASVRVELTARSAAHLTSTCLGAPLLHELHETLREMLAAPAAPLLSAARLRYGRLIADNVVESASSKAEQRQLQAPRRARQPQQRIRSAAQDADESARLQALLQRNNSSGGMKDMRTARRALPAFNQRVEVLAAVDGNRAVVIAGATGCGKSTQVPQYILENAIERGTWPTANIICTQPRRLPAVALASRVSDEIGQPCGGLVGYSVRLNKKLSRDTRLLFCTTGILLRRLVSDPVLHGVSHVIIDEVHERSLESDLLMLLLRDTLASNPELRLVLMSATADPGLFARYFDIALASCAPQKGVANECAVVEIPGFAYPVLELALEDALAATGMSLQGRKPGITEDKLAKAVTKLHAANIGFGPYPTAILESIAAVNESNINYDLIEAVIAHVIASEAADGPMALLREWPGLDDAPDMGRTPLSGPGAILVFLPGSLEISRLQRHLDASGAVKRALAGGTAEVLPLHGALPPDQQAAVFKGYGPRCRKIVLSTNVAETSVTIADVTVVIDTGKMKEMQYDPHGGVSRLAETWVSQASAKQRRGRAGRVRPGVCFRLFSRVQWQSLAECQLPEMLRSPLEPLCLSVKAVFGNRIIKDVLARALTPPDPAAVDGAIHLLRTRQLLDSEERLTPLGQHLTNIPLDPAMGKMLVYAAMLQCTDPLLTIAAALGYGRPVFLSPPHARAEADAARARIAGPTNAAKSDHVALVYAFNHFRHKRITDGASAARRWCLESFLSFDAMDAVQSGRADFANCLAELGFITLGALCHIVPQIGLPQVVNTAVHVQSARYAKRVRRNEEVDYNDPHDKNAEDARLVKAALTAGFYPQILRVDNPLPKYTQVSGGAVETDSKGVPKLLERVKGRVFVHPSSINMHTSKFETGWLVFTEMVETSKVFVRQCSMAPVYSLLLFGGLLQVNHERGEITVDEWVKLRAPAKVGVLVRELRKLLDELLRSKLEDPGKDVSAHPVVRGMLELLRTDGM